MKIPAIPFQTTDWSDVERVEYQGEQGLAYWQTRQLGDIRVRIVEYTPGYVADHWCHKGHVILCIGGELHTQLDDGRTFTLTQGMAYFVGDDAEAHRSSTTIGAKLFIVD